MQGPVKVLQVMKLSLAVFRLPIASQHVWKRIRFWQDTEGAVVCLGRLLYQRFHVYLVFWNYFDKGLLSALTSLKFSLSHVTFRTLNAPNVQLTGFKIISKPMNFTSPNESNTFSRKNSRLATTKHLGTNNYFHFSRRLVFIPTYFWQAENIVKLEILYRPEVYNI